MYIYKSNGKDGDYVISTSDAIIEVNERKADTRPQEIKRNAKVLALFLKISPKTIGHRTYEIVLPARPDGCWRRQG